MMRVNGVQGRSQLSSKHLFGGGVLCCRVRRGVLIEEKSGEAALNTALGVFFQRPL